MKVGVGLSGERDTLTEGACRADDREILVFVAPDDLAAHLATVGRHDLNAGRGPDDVLVRRDEAVR